MDKNTRTQQDDNRHQKNWTLIIQIARKEGASRSMLSIASAVKNITNFFPGSCPGGTHYTEDGCETCPAGHWMAGGDNVDSGTNGTFGSRDKLRTAL